MSEIKPLRAAVWALSFTFPGQVLGQTFIAPGHVEGAGPTMSIGIAAAGTVNEVLVHEGSRVRAGQTLLKLDCGPAEADVHTQEAHLAAAQASFDRVRNGSRPDEIAVGQAILGFSEARAEEAQKTLDRTLALQEGVTVTAARVLEVKRDARIAAAQVEEARARLSLLRAGSREEDIQQAKALRDAAAAVLDTSRARLGQCSVRAPADGIVLDVLATQGQFLSLAVPEPILHIVQDGQLRVRADVELKDLTASMRNGLSPLRVFKLNIKRSVVMNNEHIKGAADKAKGAVKDAVGGLTGKPGLQVEGKIDKAKGAAHEVAGDLKDAAKDADKEARKNS